MTGTGTGSESLSHQKKFLKSVEDKLESNFDFDKKGNMHVFAPLYKEKKWLNRIVSLILFNNLTSSWLPQSQISPTRMTIEPGKWESKKEIANRNAYSIHSTPLLISTL